MFDVYFCPRVVRRLQRNADAQILEGFLGYLHGRGHARLTIQSYVHAAELFLHRVRHRRLPLATIDEAMVRHFACRRGPRSRPRANVYAALRHLLRQLREAGLISPRAAVLKPAVEQVLSDYDGYLLRVHGLAEATRLRRRYFALEFLELVFGSRRIEWKRLRPGNLQSFIAHYGRDGRSTTTQTAAVALRSFLRWLQFQGHIAANLIGAVPRFPRWRLAALPSVMTDDQLKTFLASFGRSQTGRRDYAMALCMTELGLRAVEVAELMLDDMDAMAGTLRLSAIKSRRERVLPMTRRLRRAVIAYIRRHRPKTNDGHLFVRHRIPLGAAVSRELVRGVMRRAYASVPGCEDWTGTHVLRHTTAMHLLQADVDVTLIALWLGHDSTETTHLYVEADLEMKRRVLERINEPANRKRRRKKVDPLLDFLDRL